MSKKSAVYSFPWLSKKHGLSEEEVRNMDVAYKHADLDRSGQLDRAELTSLLKKTIAAKMTDTQVDTYLKAQWHNVDKDNSNSVDFDEFLALYAILKLENRARQGGIKRTADQAQAGDAKSKSATSSTSGAAGTTAAKSGDKSAAASKSTSASGAEKKKERKKKVKGQKKNKKVKTFHPSGELTQVNYNAAPIVWSSVARNNSFMVKRGGVLFTREPGNVTNTHGFRSSGLANVKNVHITPKGKGNQITLRLRNEKKRRQGHVRRGHHTTVYNLPERVLARKFRGRLEKYGRPELVRSALSRMTRVMEVKGRVAKRSARTKQKREAAAASKKQ